MKKSFILYNDQEEIINKLTDEQAGRLLKRIFAFVTTGVVPDIEDGVECIAFIAITAPMKRDSEKYRKKCEKKKYSLYKNKLKDPRWQKLRLKIFERDAWKCVSCLDSSAPLHVHHHHYIEGKDPWDYPNDHLETLCESCHSARI